VTLRSPRETQMEHEEAAHGGPGWLPRNTSMAEELGTVWTPCGVDSEYGTLRTVLLHRPGPELNGISNPSDALFLEQPNLARAQAQHDGLAAAYEESGVRVCYIQESAGTHPNLCFTRDLFAMTPVGAILARPASRARAGEERWAAKALADHGIPIIASIHGRGTMEGADVLALRPDLVLIGNGIRTNADGAGQTAAIYRSLGVAKVEIVQLPYGTGHLDGVLSVIDRDLAVVRPSHIPYVAWSFLKEAGFTVVDLSDPVEAHAGMAINLVTIGPRRILMPAGNPGTKKILEEHGVTCREIDVSELMKGGGAIHCLTGVLWREGQPAVVEKP
jgi:arginine deiminase